MFADQPNFARLMHGMVRRLTPDPTLREDLYQEAWLRLWEAETRRPGQTASWYLQNCRFYIQNVLKHGRSVDSPKHSAHRVQYDACIPFDDAPEPSRGLPELCSNAPEDDLISSVCARDAIAILLHDLTLPQRQILCRLLEGSTVRDIARSLGVSHVAVLKQRRRIAHIAAHFGIERARAVPISRGPK